MTHRQHPIGTGFTAASTALEVVEGLDLSGKQAVVTGGHRGIGLETTRALSAAGAHVTVAARNPERAARALAGIERVETAPLDLLDPASVDDFAARWRASRRPLHILVNNAGIMGGDLVRDARGYESHFALNHLGHFQLTLGLYPALRAAHGARVVTVSSGAQRICGIRWDDPHFTTGGYEPIVAYAQSKAANVLFSVELDRRWSTDGIRGYAVHPGIVHGTALGPLLAEGEERTPWLSTDELRAMGIVDADGRPVRDPDRELKTPEQGASTSVFAATSPLLDGIGGVYLMDNDISPLDTDPRPIAFGTEQDIPSTVVPHSIDPGSARRLWEMSERLIGR
ncbi:SDR family NAD(P)-dependent oxidoreductase [Streptomyces thermodiastaticus]|uniref:SDR family NAD(P)-dependent oxidoreductase n=1 Tax=Streptomyces thermodiastaticus TaxID=44061 RepID=UPI001675FA92|nr:SDR family NAD(P)-dependent oxidoreductase [Streptomyces thermodiastaticus]MCE7552561.1 SDR family NAD(P)-dependent oxidoreductase [Streptomyces thermodiastaticus]GHF87435.1 oxidoreductase [Streptomyces thermodiastaticus]